VLDEILSRHDRTGPAFAAEAIRSAPPGADPLRAAIDADALWQRHQRTKADEDEAEWARTKAAESDDVPWLRGTP
jgi:hypothetical protein